MKDFFSSRSSAFPVKHFTIGSLILVLLFFIVKFLIWKYSTFYLSGYELYIKWFPGKHALIFPLVKIFPFAVSVPLLFIFRNAIFNYLILLLDLVPVVISSLLKLLEKLIGISVKGISKTLFFFQKTLNKVSGIINKKEIQVNIGVLFISLLFVVVLCEIILRKADVKPGIIDHNPWFKEVDSLFVTKGFVSDSNGIFKIDTGVMRTISEDLIPENDSAPVRKFREDETLELFEIIIDLIEFRNPGFSNELKTFVKILEETDSARLIDFQKAVLNYVKKPVNDDGFNSIAFRKYESGNTSILLLGDSFTWGHSAENLTNSFANRLLAKEFIVYNTGISGADPAQYLQLAKLYIPLLQPDYVIVNLFLGNDIVYFKREIQPGRLIHFPTNAGNLINCPDGICRDNPEAAYKFTLSRIKIQTSSYFNYLCSLSSLGTVVWKSLWKINLVKNDNREYKNYYEKADSIKIGFPYCNIELAEIKKIADENGTKFITVAIPDLREEKLFLPEDIPGLTKDIPIHVPDLTVKDYLSSNGHYNDEGHRKHAELIMKLIGELKH